MPTTTLHPASSKTSLGCAGQWWQIRLTLDAIAHLRGGGAGSPALGGDLPLSFALEPVAEVPARWRSRRFAPKPFGRQRHVWRPCRALVAAPVEPAPVELDPDEEESCEEGAGARCVPVFVMPDALRKLLWAVLKHRVPKRGTGFPPEFVELLKLFAKRDLETFRLYVLLVESIPLELGDAIEAMGMPEAGGELLALAQILPEIVDLARAHPGAMARLLRVHLEPGQPSAFRRARLLRGLKRGLPEAFAALGLPLGQGLVDFLDQIGPDQPARWFPGEGRSRRDREVRPAWPSRFGTLGAASLELEALGIPSSCLAAIGGGIRLEVLEAPILDALLQVARQTRGQPGRREDLVRLLGTAKGRRECLLGLLALDARWERVLGRPRHPGLESSIGDWTVAASLKDLVGLPPDVAFFVKGELDAIHAGERILAWRRLQDDTDRQLVVLVRGPSAVRPGTLDSVRFGEFATLRAETLVRAIQGIRALWLRLLGRPLSPQEEVAVATRFQLAWGVEPESFDPRLTEEELMMALPPPTTPWFRGVAA